MNAESTPLDLTAIERLVAQVRGVLAVRVVADEQDQISELHVVGTPDRSPKAMVRDIESLLFVRGGLRLNHRKISLVQLDETLIQPDRARVQLLTIESGADADGQKVSVVLGLGDQRFTGTGSRRPNDDGQPLQLAGYATLHAVHQIVRQRDRFRLEQVARQPFGVIDVCLAHLTLETDEGVETFVGVSIVRDDELGAAARSILDAINRRVARLLAAN